MSVQPQEFDDALIKDQLSQAVGSLSHADLERLAATAPPPSRQTPDERGRIRGTILSIRGTDVFVDVGGKSEGLLSLDEFGPDTPPLIGQVVNVVPQGFDRESGLMRLSITGALQHGDLSSVKVGDIVKARVSGSNVGGLELRVQGLRCFMPLSQIDVVRHDDLHSFLGHWLECEVAEVDRRGKNLILSRRRVLERQRAVEREHLQEQLAEGQVRKGKVSRLADFGAFVDLGGIDGLLHVSDMSYSRVDRPASVLKVGEEVEVKILKIDAGKGRISLGLKQLAPDPWTLVPANYRVGDVVDGQVTRLADFGAFVEVTPGVEGLIPLSEMSWTQRVMKPSQVLKTGDHVRVSVMAVDGEKRKLTLSLKALSSDPWQTVAERYVIDSTVSGAVTRLADFGAFVQLEEGVEGLIHISQLSDKHVRRVQEVVEPGKVVQVRILAVDPSQRRISLSMKPRVVEPSPDDIAAAQVAEMAQTKKRERKKPLRGGLSW